VHGQHFFKRGWEGDKTVFVAFAFVYSDLAALKVDIGQFYADELAYRMTYAPCLIWRLFSFVGRKKIK